MDEGRLHITGAAHSEGEVVAHIPMMEDAARLVRRHMERAGSSIPSATLPAVLNINDHEAIKLADVQREFPEGHMVRDSEGFFGIVMAVESKKVEEETIIIVTMAHIERQPNGRFRDEKGNISIIPGEFNVRAFQANHDYNVGSEIEASSDGEIRAVLMAEAIRRDAEELKVQSEDADTDVDITLAEDEVSLTEIREMLVIGHLVLVTNKSKPESPAKKLIPLEPSEETGPDEVRIQYEKNGQLLTENVLLTTFAAKNIKLFTSPEPVAASADLMELLKVVNDGEGVVEIDGDEEERVDEGGPSISLEVLEDIEGRTEVA